MPNSPAQLLTAFEEASLSFPDRTPEEINSGKCFDWAAIVFDLVEGSKIAGHNVAGNGHTYVEIDGRCYDAECYEGVDDWLDLPFFKRVGA
jgi:hypothetical protein